MYTVYIDESGETGIAKVKDSMSGGASPYMTLGAVLVKDDNKSHLSNVLDKIKNTISKSTLHCNKLKHLQKVYYSKVVAEQEVVCFGIISKKSTLGEYSKMISGDNIKYFNKCSHYLLECIGEFIKLNDINPKDVQIVFEEGHHDYAKMRSYISKIQSNPIKRRAKLLKYIKINKIVDASKEKEPLLTLADLVAHSLYQIVNRHDKNYRISEIRYLRELKRRFHYAPETKKICPSGLKPIHSIQEIDLDPLDQKELSKYTGSYNIF